MDSACVGLALALACVVFACTFNHDDLGPRVHGSGGQTSTNGGGATGTGGVATTSATSNVPDSAVASDVSGTGGVMGSGGATTTIPSTLTTDAAVLGGAIGTGGPSMGGKPGSGGAGTGGAGGLGSGRSDAAILDGSVRGGATGTGGASGTGGVPSTGGAIGTGGISATGGVAGSTATPGTGGSTSSSGACGTTNGSYRESTTFTTAGVTGPYRFNKWGSWGGTEPNLAQTTTGPSGLDCNSGCAMLTIHYSSGTSQYSAGSLVEYFGTLSDSVENLLNETITAKIALKVEQASGASAAVPISISLFGQDTFATTTGVDNLWVNDLGSAASLDVAAGWHMVAYKVTDARVPSWSPTRTVCASAIHAIGITIQNISAIDDTNGAVVTLYVQSVIVTPP